MNTAEKTITGRQMVTILRGVDVEPTESFVAAAGSDYGAVEAWSLGDDGWVIAYPYGASFAEDADDLACWLESPDLGGLDTIVQTANVRGADEVSEATEEDEGPFYVLVTRYFYGPTEHSDWVWDESGGPRQFGTLQAAQDWIDKAEQAVYVTAHNESGRPAYKVVVE